MRAWTCSRKVATSEAVAEAVGAGVCARVVDETITNIAIRNLKKTLVIKKPICVGHNPADKDARLARRNIRCTKNDCAARRQRAKR